MSIPPGPPAIPPPTQPPGQPPGQWPGQPPREPNKRWRKEKLLGAGVATLAVLLIPLTVLEGGWFTVLFIAPLVAFFCVLLGSVLAIFERTRQFAVGFLIASGILIFVSAGVCAVTLPLTMGQT